jgi:hypothetical protein
MLIKKFAQAFYARISPSLYARVYVRLLNNLKM